MEFTLFSLTSAGQKYWFDNFEQDPGVKYDFMGSPVGAQDVLFSWGWYSPRVQKPVKSIEFSRKIHLNLLMEELLAI